jgi:hypothetical protein
MGGQIFARTCFLVEKIQELENPEPAAEFENKWLETQRRPGTRAQTQF